jgi:hypothetical protein
MVAVSGVSDVSRLKAPSRVGRFNRVSPDSRPSEISNNRSDLRELHRPLKNRVKNILEIADTRSERFQIASQQLHETVSALAGFELKSTDEVLKFLVGLKDEIIIHKVAEAMKIFYNNTGISKNISIAEIKDGIKMLNDPKVFKKANIVAKFAARQILDNSVTNSKLASVANNSVKKPELASLAKKSPSTTQNESLRDLAA